MYKSEGFVKDFWEFRFELARKGIEATVSDLVTLYAIYRKDLRAQRLNGSKENSELATERQKEYLRELAKDRGFRLTESDIDKMTKEEASKAITTMLGGD